MTFSIHRLHACGFTEHFSLFLPNSARQPIKRESHSTGSYEGQDPGVYESFHYLLEAAVAVTVAMT